MSSDSSNFLIQPICDKRPPIELPAFHKETPANANRELFVNYYLGELVSMYEIFSRVVEDMTPKCRINWTSNRAFNDFTILVYERSSKILDYYPCANACTNPCANACGNPDLEWGGYYSNRRVRMDLGGEGGRGGELRGRGGVGESGEKGDEGDGASLERVDYSLYIASVITEELRLFVKDNSLPLCSHLGVEDVERLVKFLSRRRLRR